MSLRRLAFVSVISGQVALLSFAPMVGSGIGLYLSLAVWAVCGFRWWLGSLALSMAPNLTALIQAGSIGAATAQILPAATANATPAQNEFAFLLQLSMLAVYPAVLWLGQRSFRRTLVKRLGASRLGF